MIDPSKKITAEDFDGIPHEATVSDLKWRPGAYGVIIRDKTILLLRQTNGYDLPGGGIDLGEMPEQAVIREIKEETGLAARNPELIDVASSYYLAFGTTNFYQSIMIYYGCEVEDGELSTAGFDAAEQKYAEAPEWVSLDRLDEIAIGSTYDFREIVNKYLRK